MIFLHYMCSDDTVCFAHRSGQSLLVKDRLNTRSQTETLIGAANALSLLFLLLGYLRREKFDPSAVHPIVLDPNHQITKLLIKDFDDKMLHPGPEQVFAEVHCTFWILRSREAIHQHHTCLKYLQHPTWPIYCLLVDASLSPHFIPLGWTALAPIEKRWAQSPSA